MNGSLELKTPLYADLHQLVDRGGSVPDGWRAAYTETIARLYAVACDGRAHVRLDGPLMADCNMYVTHRGGDRVIKGILGRLERTTAQTCEVCGQPGRLRVFERTVKVLCSVCAAPRFALQAVSQLLSDLKLADDGGSSKTLTFDDAPIVLRPMLPAEVWEPLIDGSGDEPPTYATSLHLLQALRPRLEAVRQALEATLETANGT